MSKALTQNDLRRRWSVPALSLTMALSLAAFGCTTNQFQTAGEPMTSRAGGSVTPVLSSTPGSAVPATMISGAVDPVVDAIATIEADLGYQGRVLGPAAPGNGAPSISQQIQTGQFVSPAVPQLTLNSSISSPASVPAIVSGAAGDAGAVVDAGAIFGGAVVGNAVTGGTVGNAGLPHVGSAGPTVGTSANFGVTGLSNTTATGLTNATSATTNIAGGTNAVVSTGVAAAPSTASSLLATPTLGTSPRLNVDNTALARGIATTSGALTVNNNGIATNTVTTGGVARAGGVSNVRVVTRGGRTVVTNQQQ